MLLPAGGSPRRLRDDFFMIFAGFWYPFGEPGGTLWGSFGRQSFTMERLWTIFRCFFSGASKRSGEATKSHPKRSLFGGGGHGSSVVNSGPN